MNRHQQDNLYNVIRRSANPGRLLILLVGVIFGLTGIFAAPVPAAVDDRATLNEPNAIAFDPVEDGIVNLADLGFFSEVWLTADCNVPDWCQGTDLDRSGSADMNDLLVIADYWLVIGDVNVPDVNGLTLLEAQSAIVQAGLITGTISQQLNDLVAPGCVISQDPPAGARKLHGTLVNLLISQGVAPVAVPGVTGMTQAQAQATIVAAGLTVGTVSQQFSATVPAGRVISQNPLAEAEVPPGDPVHLIVSRGIAPVTVPNVVGKTEAQAQTALVAAGLTLGTVSQQFSATVPAGGVISQDPLAGTEVPPGTAVDLVVSLGSAPVTVPDLTGMTQTQAQTTLAAAGLTVGTVSQQFSGTVPEGRIISQNPPAGMEVSAGTPVDMIVSVGASIVVPGVIGLPRASAEAAITAAQLTVGTVTEEFSDTVPLDHVVTQAPLEGVPLAAGAPVDLVISLGPPAVVPDVVGMSLTQAQAAVSAAGLLAGPATPEHSALTSAGLVSRQWPIAAEQVVQGTTVDLYVSTGPTCFYVSMTGSDQNDGSSPVNQSGGVGPFATIQKGLTILADRDAVGDVLCIRGGTYLEECTGFGGINAVGPVMITNYDDEEVCIDGGEPVTGWAPCDPNETGMRVCGMLPPDWASYCGDVYKAQVAVSKIYAIADRPYYGVKLVCDNELLFTCGTVNMPAAAFPDLENYGWNMTSGTTDTLRDTTHLTEPNGFWENAFVWFIGNVDNIAYCRRIIDSNSLEQTITFDPCDAGVDRTSKYWICNHPHYLNDPGEYYWDPNDADGFYTIYYYRRPGETLSDLNSRMKVLSKSAGIRLSISSKNLVIRGLNFRNCQTRGSYDYTGRSIEGGPTGQCGFICATNWCNSVSNITIQNCTFENFYGNDGAAIVFGECESGIVVDNCVIRDIGRGGGIRTYGQATDKTQGFTVKDCTLERIWGSNIRPYFADNIQITGNTVSQFDGVHGNAVTVYGSCDNILIAHNTVIGGTNAMVMKDTHDMYIFGNTFRSSDESGSVSVWDVDYRAVTGDLYVLQNTILTSSSTGKALFFLGQNSSFPPTANVVVKNNIIDGFEYGAQWNPLVVHDFNLYLRRSTHQSGHCSWCSPWVYGSSELVNIDGHPEEFVDYANRIYTLQPTSHAVGSGTDLSAEIAVMQAAFGTYDFSVDLQGGPRQSPPSMGAFECSAP